MFEVRENLTSKISAYEEVVSWITNNCRASCYSYNYYILLKSIKNISSLIGNKIKINLRLVLEQFFIVHTILSLTVHILMIQKPFILCFTFRYMPNECYWYIMFTISREFYPDFIVVCVSFLFISFSLLYKLLVFVCVAFVYGFNVKRWYTVSIFATIL